MKFYNNKLKNESSKKKRIGLFQRITAAFLLPLIFKYSTALYFTFLTNRRLRVFCLLFKYLIMTLFVIRYSFLLFGNLLQLADSFMIFQGHGGLAPYVVLQMNPGEPEPAPPPGEPSIPANAFPNPPPLIPDEDRMRELGDRLSINCLSGRKNWSPEVQEAIVETQLQIEKLIEKALLSDGASPDTLLAKRHQIRALLFYPRGTPFSGSTYNQYLSSMENCGTHRSLPYQRIMDAIYNKELDLPLPVKK